ncbi:MAG TPA: hypothetical protein VGH42_00425 [Verrucomicrobiae bacterium]
MSNLMNKNKIVGLAVLFCSYTLFAEIGTLYDNSKPPTLSLPDAYQRATIALGTATNQFHCISAKIDTRFSSNGEWYFTFYSTNSQPKWVTVEFSGKTHVENMEPLR